MPSRTTEKHIIPAFLIATFGFVAIGLAIFYFNARASDVIWDGGGSTNNWSEAANWSGDTVPSASDIAIFNSTSTKDVTVDVPINISGISLSAGYTGTMTQAASSPITTGGAFTIASGTFIGGDTVEVDDLNISGGTFNATPMETRVHHYYNHSGGVFNHNNGTVVAAGGSVTNTDYSWYWSGTETFYNFREEKCGGSSVHMNTGTTMQVNGTLHVVCGLIKNGTVNAMGDALFSGFADGAPTGGTAVLLLGNDAVAQTVTINDTTTPGTLWFNMMPIRLDSPADAADSIVVTTSHAQFSSIETTTAFSGTIPLSAPAGADLRFNRWLQSRGTYDASTHANWTVAHLTLGSGANLIAPAKMTSITDTSGPFSTNGIWDVQTSFSVNDLDIRGSWTVATGDTIVVLGTFSPISGSLSTGTVDARGPVLAFTSFSGPVTSGAGTFLISGSMPRTITLSNGGTWPNTNVTGSNVIFQGNTSGNFTFSNLTLGSGGTFHAGAGSVFLGQTFTDQGTFNGSTGYVSATAFVLSGTGVFNAPTGTLSISTSWTHTDTTSTFNHNNGTVEFSSTGTIQTPTAGESFYNFTKSTTGSTGISLPSKVIVRNTLTLNGGTLNGGTVSALGNIVQASGFSGGTATIDFDNDSLAQTYTIAGGTVLKVRFDSDADAADAIINNQATGTVLFQGITTTSAFTQPIPLPNPRNQVYQMASWSQAGGSYDASAQTTWQIGTFSLTGGTFNAPVNTVAFGSLSTWDLPTTKVFNNFEINLTSNVANVDIASGDTLIVDGLLTLTRGWCRSGEVQVNGNVTQASTYGPNTQTTACNIRFGNPSASQTYTINGGTTPAIVLDSADDASDSIVVNSSTAKIWKLDTTSGFSGNIPLSNPSNFALTFLSLNIAGGSYNAGSQTGWTIGNLTISGGSFTPPQTVTLGVNTANQSAPIWDVQTSLALQNLFAGVFSWTIGTGDTIVVNGTYTQTNLNGGVIGGTIELLGNGTISSGGGGSGSIVVSGSGKTITMSGGTLPNFTLNGVGTTFSNTSTSALTINGNLTIQNGTFTKATGNIDLNGNFAISGGTFTPAPTALMTVSGNWSNTGGTFNAGSGTVQFDGTTDVTLVGSTTFFNFTRTGSSAGGTSLIFPAGATQTILGSFQASSTSSSNRLRIRSSVPGTQAAIDPRGTRTVSNLDVQDSNNINATAINCATGCLNSGNNTNWTLPSGGGDTTPPDTTITSGPSGATNSTTATFTFTANEPSTFTCKLDTGAASSCTSPKVYSGLTNGSHTVSITATDLAGNVDPTPATRTWTVDTIPPDTTITSSPSALTTSTTASFSFSSTEPGGFTCQLDGFAATSCTSPMSYSGIPDGSHVFTVYATDLAGNVDPTPAQFMWTVDTTAPVVTSTTVTPSIIGTDAQLTIMKTVTDAVGVQSVTADVKGPSSSTASIGTVSLVLSSGTAQNGTWSGIFTFPAAELAPDGTYAVTDTAIDTVGNSVQVTDGSALLDRTEPTLTLSAITPAVVQSSGSVTVEVSASDLTSGFANEDSVTAKDLDTGTMASLTSFSGSLAAGETGYWTFTQPAGSPEGVHNEQVKAVDRANNTTTQSGTYKVDDTPPDTAISAGVPNPTNSTTATFTFDATEVNSSFLCRLDLNPWDYCTSPAVYGGLLDGGHHFEVFATDIAGNADMTPATWDWLVDTIAPETTITSGPAAVISTSSVTLEFVSSEAGSSYTCRLDGFPIESCTSPKSYTGLTEGSYHFEVFATDAAGNLDQTAAVRDWTVVLDADGDGVPDASDQCPAVPGISTYFGCPFGEQTSITLHIVDQQKSGICGYEPNGKAKGACDKPLSGSVVKLFDRENPNFVAAYGSRPNTKDIANVIYEAGVGLAGQCTTDGNGVCLSGVDHAGRYMVIAKYQDGSNSVYTSRIVNFRRSANTSAEDDDADTDTPTQNETFVRKNLHFMKTIKKDGSVTYQGGKMVVVTGSELDVAYPEYAVWDAKEQLYPFVLTSAETWNVNVCLSVPAGYDIVGIMDPDGNVITTADCNQTLVAGTSTAIIFRILDIGSPEPNFLLSLNATHAGKNTKQDLKIEGIREASKEKNDQAVKDKINAKPRQKPAATGNQPVSQPESKPVKKSGFWASLLGIFGL